MADVGRGQWPEGASSACAVIGAACLWAWGYVVSLSPALFPDAAVMDSIGIEFAYYASQLTLLVLACALVAAMRRWRPSLSPALAGGASAVLAASTVALAALMRTPAAPVAAVVACGVANGAGGMALSVAWGARFTLGSCASRRLVLLSFLGGYGIYLAFLYLPSGVSALAASALPLASGALWLVDSWRRHLLTSEVWPTRGDVPGPGEAAAGLTDPGILPWGTMALFGVTALVGNVVSSLLMGATYAGAGVIFPGAFIVCGCITAAALAVLGRGARRLSVERLYRYCLPFAVLGMLIILVAPTGGHALAGSLVTGASIFLQALVMLKVVESTQETGASPLLAFGVGQGVIGGVVCLGNVGGRLLSTLPDAADVWLPLVCAAGVFALFFLLTMVTDGMSERLARECRPAGEEAQEEVAPEAPSDERRLDALAGRYALTPREREVLALLVQGRSLPYIAERLFVTTGTVKTHALHIYRKVGVGGKQELISLYERER